MRLIISVDDGYTADLTLAEELFNRQLRATFFVPAKNSEGLSVIEPYEIKAMHEMGHEIASHTYNHVYLTGIPIQDAKKEIMEGRDYLENILGEPVRGFCFPGGKYNANIVNFLAENDFLYARTVRNFNFRREEFLHHPSVQFFNHSALALIVNKLKQGPLLSRDVLRFALSKESYPERVLGFARMLNERNTKDNYFHLWCHTWEVEKFMSLSAYADFCDDLSKMTSTSIPINQEMEKGK